MKQFFNIVLAICTSAALLASCTKEMQETTRMSSVNWKDIVINGIQEGGELSKTSVDGTTGRLYWSPGDEIAVFLGTAGTKYVAQNTEKAATTTFVCSSSSIIGSTEGSGDILYGLYPFDADATSDGSTITTTLSDTQKAEEGTFRDSLFITMGKATRSNPTMGFYNLCGGVRFTVATERISSVTFKGNNDEVLAGKVKISMGSEGVPVVAEVIDGKREVTLTCTEGFKVGTMYYITTLPASLTNGYTMTFETADRTGILTADSQATIKRSVFVTIENADDNAVWNGIVNIPDAGFKAYCVANFDLNGDGEISYDEAKNVARIDIDTKGIESLKGLEAFVNLGHLDCHLHYYRFDGLHYYDVDGNEISGLKSLDVSKNIELEYLLCEDNQLTSLDVSKNPELKLLSCNGNRLTSLDVSKSTELTELSCYNNQLTSLDMSNNPVLTILLCYGNQLTNLDVSKSTELDYLYCNGNLLTSLVVSANTALTYLYCNDNQLTSLDVSKNTELAELSCYNNQLASLEVSNNTELTDLVCKNNQLTSLDVSKNTELDYLSCDGNLLTSLDVSKNTMLTRLYCYSNPNLKILWINNGQSTEGFYYDTYITEVKYKVGDGEIETVAFKEL